MIRRRGKRGRIRRAGAPEAYENRAQIWTMHANEALATRWVLFDRALVVPRLGTSKSGVQTNFTNAY
jgi:hypothetical protein